MDLKEIVNTKIRAQSPRHAPVTDDSDLFADLGLDSLSFVTLLVALEDDFGVTFDIGEMESCLRVGTLVETLARKTAAAEK